MPLFRPAALGRRNVRRLLLAGLLLLADRGAPAAAPVTVWRWSKQDQRRIEALEKQVEQSGDLYHLATEHWDAGSQVSARFTAELGLFLEQFIETMGAVIGAGANVDLPRRPEAVVYRDEAAYLQATGTPPGSRGIFQYAWDADGTWTRFRLASYIAARREEKFPRFYTQVLLHEGTHLLLQGMAGRIEPPVWLHEGMATFFQYWRPQFSLAYNRKRRYLHSELREVLRDLYTERRGELPSLSAFLHLTPRAFHVDGMGPRARKNYALAESFVDYLFSCREGRALFGTILARLRAREMPLLGEKEIEEHEPKWHRRIREVLGHD